MTGIHEKENIKKKKLKERRLSFLKNQLLGHALFY
jgi:hypothetical protein